MPSGTRIVPTLCLASASPRRLALLAQLGVIPAQTVSPEIDETARRQELPRHYAERMALEKLSAGAALKSPEHAILLAADTVVAVGRRILPKAETPDEARSCLALLSGRAHCVMTAVAVQSGDRAANVRVVETRVRFKRLSAAEIDAYLSSGEWSGKAGGYAIQGRAAGFVAGLSGSYSGVVGLPLFETAGLLEAAGLPVRSD